MADTLLKIPKDLFKNVKFYLAEDGKDKVKDLLKQGGATREFFFSNLATHVISSTVDFPEYEQAKEIGIPIVKPEWVIYSVKCEAMMPTNAFSVGKKLFTDVVACPSQVPPADRDALWSMITFYGGRCQTTFDPSCTHLLVPKPEGEKYEVALQHKEKVKIVVPEWILDCIKAKALLDESKYVPVSDPEAQSQSILTPDNHGETTGVVVSTGIERAVAAPSSLLSPDSPAGSKLRKSSGTSKGSEKSSEFDAATDKEKRPKEGIKIRPGRHAAENAKQALRTLVDQGVLGELDESDDVYTRRSSAKELGKSSGVRKEVEVKQNGCGDTSSKTTSNAPEKEVIVSKLLSGCVFFISDYQYTVPFSAIDMWKKVIKQNAGEVEEAYSQNVTHVLCSHQHGEHFRRAIADGKRVVTCHWLNDVILNQKLIAPQTAIHLPVAFKDKFSRCRNMIISVTGFQGKEREALKNMIYMIGAKYAGYLSRTVTHLICQNQTSEKYKKANEWGITCTNARWIGDIMTGGCDYPVNMKRYRTFGNENELDINEILARELLEAWKGFEVKEDVKDNKRKLEMLEREMRECEEANKKPRLEETARTPELMNSGPTTPQTSVPSIARTSTSSSTEFTTATVVSRIRPRVVFTGLNPGAVRRLTEKLSAMGGDTATSIRSCTHIVASKIMRTIKFLTGISVCRYIVSPQWIDKSHAAGHYLDEKDYVLHDADGESLYGMSLPQSIERAQAKPLFQGITIYVTANVRPDQKSMAEILDCAGGKLMAELPPKSSLKSLAEGKTEDGHPAFVCVTCEEDTHMCKDMKMAGIGVHNVEFVLSGILKQQLDFYRYKF
ncbi:PAX-interacting protein 1-like [Dendronephthya gigantea]|uniref:PAX-interacting protein 1-like n=1 Tax=Dendronephthya gigantea TaxID=151771 RepID=UPI00106A8473|nr:PAX-interacting protein 1-like [Dendronephthya gigantea]